MGSQSPTDAIAVFSVFSLHVACASMKAVRENVFWRRSSAGSTRALQESLIPRPTPTGPAPAPQPQLQPQPHPITTVSPQSPTPTSTSAPPLPSVQHLVLGLFFLVLCLKQCGHIMNEKLFPIYSFFFKEKKIFFKQWLDVQPRLAWHLILWPPPSGVRSLLSWHPVLRSNAAFSQSPSGPPSTSN